MTSPATAKTGPVPWPVFMILAVVFGVSHTQFPLYYLNQNQYFFHGLARAGVGLLRNDWLAHTVDPVPVFSALVYLTQRYLDQRLFYLYYVVLLGVFAYSVLGIASLSSGIGASRSRYFVYFALLTALASPIVGRLSTGLVGVNLGGQVLSGVALQSVLGPVFQPSTFGILLLLSIYLFLSGRSFLAVVVASLTATVHPTYLLSAAMLTLSYLAITVKRGEGFRRAFGLGLVALILTLPISTYVYVNFGPSAPDIWRESQSILVNFRGPWHAVVARWLGPVAYLKVGLVIIAAYLVRRTELAWIILPSFVAATGLTALQVLTESTFLVTLLPWRLSVFLVPVAACVVLGRALTWMLGGFERRLPGGLRVLAALSVVALGVLTGLGSLEMAQRFRARDGDGSAAAVMEWVRATRSPGDQYVVPLDLENFRLSTGVPVFVDFNFIPYRDVEVVKWYRRFRLAQRVFDAEGDLRCERVNELSSRYQVTRVILRRDRLTDCDGWTLLFEHTDYTVYGKGG